MVNSQKLGRRIVMGRPDISLNRRNYLRDKKKLMKELPQSEWFYLDETFVHKNLIRKKALVRNNQLPPGRLPLCSGVRFIILHVGSKNGFLSGCELVFRGKNIENDYHTEMNSTVFEDWVKTKLLVKLPPNSIIVMDNASYHSRIADKDIVYSTSIINI